MSYPSDRENTTLSFGWERPKVVTLVGNSPTATAISGFSGLTASQLSGQALRVLSGNQKGEMYWIIDNTADTLTVQGLTTPNESGNAIGATDRVAYSTNGICPTLSTCNIYPGQVNAFTPPAREQEVDSRYVHGEGTTRLKGFVKKVNFEGGSIPVIWQEWPELLLSLGDFATTGTDVASGGDGALDGSVIAWDDRVTLTDASNYATNDYIQIDTDDDAEIRKIIARSDGSETLTLEHPLDHSHTTAATCNEVTKPYTTTVKPQTRVNRSFTLCRVITDVEGDQDPIIQTWSGCYINTCDFKCDEDSELTSTLGVVAMTDRVSYDGTLTAPTVTSNTEDFYHWEDSAVQWNSADIAIVQSFSANWNWNMEAIRCLGSARADVTGFESKGPYRYLRKYPSFDMEYTYIPVNLTLFNAVRDATERDGYVKLSRDTNDYIQLNWIDGIGKSDPMDSPESGYYETTFSSSLEAINITIVNDDPSSVGPMY